MNNYKGIPFRCSKCKVDFQTAGDFEDHECCKSQKELDLQSALSTERAAREQLQGELSKVSQERDALVVALEQAEKRLDAANEADGEILNLTCQRDSLALQVEEMKRHIKDCSEQWGEAYRKEFP